jgi:hypothetical protein
MRHSLYKYYSTRKWADAFVDGKLRFNSLAYFRDFEDAQVRGDKNEGKMIFRPEDGLVITNHTQSKARRSAATVLRRSPRPSTEKRIGNFDRSYSAPAVALSQVRRTDGRRRTIHGGTTPTPFSTPPGHGCMKSFAHTPHSRRCLRYTQTSSSCPRLGSLRPSTRLCSGAPPATSAALTTPANFNPSVSLHSICIRPASAAPAASF